MLIIIFFKERGKRHRQASVLLAGGASKQIKGPPSRDGCEVRIRALIHADDHKNERYCDLCA